MRRRRSVADGGTVDIWGDGEQTRTYCYIDDCVEGIHLLMRSHHAAPLNLGSDQLITINELAQLAARAAGRRVRLRHVDGPQGVRGRGSDNTRMRAVLDWEPRVTLEDGMRRTYEWIAAQLRPPEASEPERGDPHVMARSRAHPAH